MSDKEKIIVQKIINRDEKSLLSLYSQYETPLYNFVYKQLKDSHVSEEIVQDVFMDFVEALRDFQFQCSLKTFIYTIARNKVIDTIRKKKIKRVLFSALPAYVVEGLSAVVIDEEIEQKEVSTKIKTVMDGLPHDYQLILRLKYMEGERVQTIAEKLQLTFKATESLLFRARKAFVKVFNSSQ